MSHETPKSSTFNGLLAVDIDTFKRVNRDITFDVYLKLSEDNVCHVFSRSSGLDYRRLAQYIQKGVRELYIRNEDEPAFRKFSDRTSEAIFADPSVSPEKKIATLLNMTEQNLSELFSRIDVNDESAQSTRRVVGNYLKLLTENPKSLATLLKLASHGDYLYYHSIAVSVFSIFVAKATGRFGEKNLEQIGMGGFLHDVGCTQLPKEIIESPYEFTQEQWSEMHQHSKLGLAMLEGAPSVPQEVRYMVYQHHEAEDGTGYPNALKGSAIFYPAKIVAIADGLSALISRRPHRGAFTLEEALEILEQQSGKRYDAELIRVVSSIFSSQAGARKRET